MDTRLGEVTVKIVYQPSENGSTVMKELVPPKGQNLLPLKDFFFPFRVDLFSKGIWCTGKQTVSHKSCHFLQILAEKYQVYQVSLNKSELQSNLNGSNIFGTMEICSRNG